jgi:hypothetical protein
VTQGTVSIEIPNSLFEQLKRRAEVMHRPVEDLVIQTLAAASPLAGDLPTELAAELDAMANFSDDALWAATKPSISLAERSRLEQLNQLAGERELSATETREQSQLLLVWQRSLARRARAFTILQLRGHPLPEPDQLRGLIDEAA